MKISLAFWNTSAIVPLCCFQTKSQQLRQIRRKYEIVASWISLIEGNSALKRLLFENAISQNAYAEAVKRLKLQSKAWREIKPTGKVRELAEDFNPKSKLENSRLVYKLASALVWCFEKPKGRVFVCCDGKLSDSAEKLGFTTLPV